MALLTDEQVRATLATLPGWQHRGKELVKEYRFPDFRSAVAFVNRLTDVAEELGHHPDLTVGWGRVGVALSTHSEGGITQLDAALAARIDALPAE